jgi:hypothetical protein
VATNTATTMASFKKIGQNWKGGNINQKQQGPEKRKDSTLKRILVKNTANSTKRAEQETNIWTGV